MAMISGSLVFKAAESITKKRLTFDGNDKLRNDWKYLSTTLLKHIEHSLHSEESVWVLLFSDAFEEDWEIMMVVELLDLNFPVDLVLRTVFDGDGKISSVIEASEFTGRDGSLVESTSSGLLRCRSFLGLVQTDSLATEAFSFLKNSCELGYEVKNLQTPLAAMLISCLSMGSTSVTVPFLAGM